MLEELNIIRDQTLQVHGISAPIAEYFVSQNLKPEVRARKIHEFQGNLSLTAYEHAHDEDYESLVIHLSPEDRHKAQSLLLAWIQYDNMIDRQNRIAIAHESTFKWIFHDGPTGISNSSTKEWSSFQKWLESDEQVYWITGKAGSGKSTLMKFLCSPTNPVIQTKDCQGPQEGKVDEELDEAGQPHSSQDLRKFRFSQEQSRCHPYLRRWANTYRLVVASFYFWNSGTELQMTTMGLLRTILYQICAQRPDLLPNLMPKPWESACLFDRLVQDWTTSKFLEIVSQAIRLLSEDSKICIFIDGLDEFGNDHENLISMVHSLIEQHAHVKLCVASRPWNIFQRTLGHNANLRLEDLTFDDIKTFVQSKFKADPGFDNLRQRYPSFAGQLMDNIVVKASGVFLWVDLVVASLLAGMQLGDRIEDFQRRLDELPPELEKLYEKILQSLDPFYLGHAAQYFAWVEAAESPLTILQFSFADEESPLSAITIEAGSMSENQISLRIEAMKRRLNSRCKGFLEVDRSLQEVQEDSKPYSWELTIQYLHRTVRDFIKTPKAQDFLQTSTKPNFDPSIQLCVAYLLSMKCWQNTRARIAEFPFDRVTKTPASSVHAIQFLRQASRILKMNEGAMITMMEHFKRLITQPRFRDPLMKDFKACRDYYSGQHPGAMLATGRGSQLSRTRSNFLDHSTWGMESFAVLPDDESFLSLAVMYNIIPYVRANAQWGGLTQRSTSQTLGEQFPLLYDVLSRDVPEPQMVECLLDKGADPNFRISKVDSQTPWILALTKVTILYTLKHTMDNPEEYSAAEDKWMETLRLMYTRGGMYAKVPDSFFSPISRKILQDVVNEVPMTEKSRPRSRSWLGSLWMGWY